jgi:hypothetical protein
MYKPLPPEWSKASLHVTEITPCHRIEPVTPGSIYNAVPFWLTEVYRSAYL